ncbi:MAG TPA: SDR family oxidoreductase [Usitatibacter sp.]|jgi:3-oxoacyl-[acyl-carrier protein] reductase|nr:SDR family oxidoreductase [Usitatibacter sp.]
MSMAGNRELEGRVALVTGASRNIGRAIALALAEAGASIVASARVSREEAEETASQVRARGGKAVVQLADVTDEGAVASLAKAAQDSFGRLDIVVNNAAVRDVATIDDIDYAAWRRITSIILDGAFLVTKACLPLLRASGQGAIVNIGGMSGHSGAAGRPHVVAAKMGLVGFTRALAHDLAKDSITANCVVPGLIATQRGASAGRGNAHLHEPLVGRRGKPEEVAAAVRFLAGPDARYVTGQDWHVNGGAYLG